MMDQDRQITKELLRKGYKQQLTPSILLGAVEQDAADLQIADIYRTLHHNVQATGEGHLFRNFLPLKESMQPRNSLSSRLLGGMRWSQIRNAYRYSARNLLRSTPIDYGYWVTHNHSYNYYHWLLEVLPKLVLIARDDPSARIILPRWLEPITYVRESLAILGLKDIVYIPAGTSLKVDRLYTISEAVLNRELLFEVRDVLRQSANYNAGPERIYLSRSDARKRRVENETEIRTIVEEYGFRVVETAGMSLKQQIELFSNCRVLVSMHGAGLTNMLFMPPDSTILEFRIYNEAFLPLASVLGHRHFSLPSQKIGNRSGHHAHANVDPGLLRDALEQAGAGHA